MAKEAQVNWFFIIIYAVPSPHRGLGAGYPLRSASIPCCPRFYPSQTPTHKPTHFYKITTPLKTNNWIVLAF